MAAVIPTYSYSCSCSYSAVVDDPRTRLIGPRASTTEDEYAHEYAYDLRSRATPRLRVSVTAVATLQA